MKIFISQPMNNRTLDEIKKERLYIGYVVGKAYPQREIEILDTLFDLGDDAHALQYLGKSIEIMADADLVVFAKGWQHARGCRIEHDCAVDYDKDIALLYVLEKILDREK